MVWNVSGNQCHMILWAQAYIYIYIWKWIFLLGLLVSCLLVLSFSHYAAPIILSSWGSVPKQTLNLSCFVISSAATVQPTSTCPAYRFNVSRRVAVMHELAALVLVLGKLMGYSDVMYVTHWQDTMGRGMTSRTDGIWYDVPSLLWKVNTYGRLAVWDDELMEGCLNS